MRKSRINRARIAVFLTIGFAIFIATLSQNHTQTAPPDSHLFSISRNNTASEIKDKLRKQDFMKGHWFFGAAILLHGGYRNIKPGGYKLADSMSSWTIAETLTSSPPLKWVVIPEGLRKEQIADRLATALGWKSDKREGFLSADIKRPYDLYDGFYFPDTYLIPVDESVEQVSKRFLNRFNENFDPYVSQFQKANIKADTALKIASILQREAGGKDDMPLIAGILWNRLLIKMPLEVDATLQYARGDAGKGYWAPITVADKKIDSPYNTYKNAGLPPSPISNPGINAIDAVLHSTETKCLFYLHDNNRQIHCSEDYAGHLENINTYLKNQ